MNRKVWVLSAKYLHRGDLEEWFNPKPLMFISWCIRCRNSLSEVMFKKIIYSNLSQVTPTTILQSFFITVVYQRFPKSLRETVFRTRKTWVQGFVSHLKVTKIFYGKSIILCFYYSSRSSASQEFTGTNNLSPVRLKVNQWVVQQIYCPSQFLSNDCRHMIVDKVYVVWEWSCIICRNRFKRAHTFLGRYL